MNIESQFYYPVTLAKGNTNAIKLYAPWVQTLGIQSPNDIAVAVLTVDSGISPQGLYVWSGTTWRFVVPLTLLSSWVLYGFNTYIYIGLEQSMLVPGGAEVFLNGQAVALIDNTLPAGNNVYVVAVPSATLGGYGPTGSMTIGQNLTFANNVLSVPAATPSKFGVVSAQSGSGLQLNAGQLALAPATATNIGGVYVPPSSGITLGADGSILNSGVLSVDGQTGAVNLTPSSVGLPNNLLSGAGGTLATVYLPASLLGAVDYMGSYNASTNTPSITTGTASSANKGFYYVCNVAGAVNIDGITQMNLGDWIISNGTTWSRVPANAAVSSVNGLLGAVVIKAIDQNTASGTSLISDSGSTTGTIKLRTISAGSGLSLALDTYNNIQLSAKVSTINGQIGDVVIKAQSANSASGISLIEDGGATTGLIKLLNLVAGTGMAFSTDANGNIVIASTSSGVSQVSGQSGVVTIEAIPNNNATGKSLVADSGATTGLIKLLNIVAGNGMSLSNDANGNLILTATAFNSTVSSVSGQTGNVVVKAQPNNNATGTSLVSDNGATTGIIKLLNIVAGTNITVDTDANGNVRINSPALEGQTVISVDGLASANSFALSPAQYNAPGQQYTGTLGGNPTVTYPAVGHWWVNSSYSDGGIGYRLNVVGQTGSPTTLLPATEYLLMATPTGLVVVGGSLRVSSFNGRNGDVTLRASDVTGVGGLLNTSPTITGRTQSDAYSFTVVSLGSVTGAHTLDLGTASEWTMTISGATSIAFTNSLAAGVSEVAYLRITNGGSAAVSWPAGTKFVAGTAPSLTAAGVDLLGVVYDTTTSTYMVFVIGLNIQ